MAVCPAFRWVSNAEGDCANTVAASMYKGIRRIASRNGRANAYFCSFLRTKTLARNLARNGALIPFGNVKNSLKPDAYPGRIAAYPPYLRSILAFSPCWFYFLAPEYLLDIPTAYMLKNRLHASAPEVSMFRLLSGIPLYVAFLFGLVRDLWNPFGWRDRGYFFLFAPLTAAVFLWMAFTPLSWGMLLTGMILAMATFRLMFAAYQGLIALIGQETLMSGRLSTLSNTVFTVAIILAAFIYTGLLSENLFPPHRSSFWWADSRCRLHCLACGSRGAVFGHAYDAPLASGSDFRGDVRRLVRHRAHLPGSSHQYFVELQPGPLHANVQVLSDEQKLHAPDDAYSNFMGFFLIGLIPHFFCSMVISAPGFRRAGFSGGEHSSPYRR